MAKLFLLLLPLLLFSWEDYKTIDNIVLYKKYEDKFDFVQFKAETIMSININDITTVIINPKTYTSWLSDCIKAEDRNKSIYILMQPPWPLMQRQVLTNLSIKKYLNKTDIRLISLNNQAPTSKKIWFNYLYAQFTLEKLDENRTKVSLSLLGDPGGFPPSWMVNLMAWEIPYKSLRDLNIYIQDTLKKSSTTP